MAQEDYTGHLILSGWTGIDGCTSILRIDQADPRVAIKDSILIVARDGDNPWVSINEDGNALTIRDDFGKRYIYRLDRYDELSGCWEASWPD